MKKYTFNEEERWKDLIPSDFLKFEKSTQFREVDAKPSREKLIKLFDNDVYDIVVEKFENANGAIDFRLYLQFKRNTRVHIATNSSSIWQINDTNRYNSYATFGQIYSKYSVRVIDAMQKLMEDDTQSKSNVLRYLNIFMKRKIKQCNRLLNGKI